MNFYQEIMLIPDAEISPYFLWGKVYKQVHLALVEIKNKHGIDGIGVSFPDYQYVEKGEKTFATLGYKIRFFANNQDDLEKFSSDLVSSLKGAEVTDYVLIRSIKAVPEHTKFVVVKRYRYKDFDKKVAEFAKFKGIDEKEALEHCLKYKRPMKHYPFISLKSETNQSIYKLSICQEVVKETKKGGFNTYGINNLSNDVTVPHW